MSTEKEPDYAGIAEREAAKANPLYTNSDVSVSADALELANRIVGIRRKAYASCMEARLRSDWETIRLLRALGHHEFCQVVVLRDADTLMPKAQGCTCGLSAHLSKLLEPFTL